MRLLYKIVHNLLLLYVPVLLVASSVVINLPNSDLHKQILKSGDFYGQLSRQLQSFDTSKIDVKNGISPLVSLSAIRELATPSWLQNLTEQNVDLTSRWLSGEDQDWVFYLPTEEIQAAVAKQIDGVTTDLVGKDSSKITACSDTEAQLIKQQGFASNQALCLPKEVLDGKQTLTQYLALNDVNVQQNFLDSLLRNNSLSSLTTQVKVSSINLSLKNRLNDFRDNLIWLRANIWIFLGIGLLLLIIDILLALSVNRSVWKELRRVSWLIAISTLSLIITLILAFGGSAYLTVRVNQLFLPGLSANDISGLVLWAVIKLSFDLFIPGLLVVLLLLLGTLGALLLEKFEIFGSVKAKNTKLQQSSKPGATVIPNQPPSSPTMVPNNVTLDGEFHRIMQQKAAFKESEHNSATFDTPQDFVQPTNQQTQSQNVRPSSGGSIQQADLLQNHVQSQSGSAVQNSPDVIIPIPSGDSDYIQNAVPVSDFDKVSTPLPRNVVESRFSEFKDNRHIEPQDDYDDDYTTDLKDSSGQNPQSYQPPLNNNIPEKPSSPPKRVIGL